MRIGRWTVRDVVQGKPWAHPTHPMFVHFPTALYPVAAVFDVMAMATGDGRHVSTAAILLGIGLLAAAPAIVTGLVDWSVMVKGSTKRRAVTRHLLVQSAAQALAAVAFVLHVVRAGTAGLVVLAASLAALLWGNWTGGRLVYGMAMRVGGRPEPTPPRAGEA